MQGICRDCELWKKCLRIRVQGCNGFVGRRQDAPAGPPQHISHPCIGSGGDYLRRAFEASVDQLASELDALMRYHKCGTLITEIEEIGRRAK